MTEPDLAATPRGTQAPVYQLIFQLAPISTRAGTFFDEPGFDKTARAVRSVVAAAVIYTFRDGVISLPTHSVRVCAALQLLIRIEILPRRIQIAMPH